MDEPYRRIPMVSVNDYGYKKPNPKIFARCGLDPSSQAIWVYDMDQLLAPDTSILRNGSVLVSYLTLSSPKVLGQAQ